jgi:hypothetical protein
MEAYGVVRCQGSLTDSSEAVRLKCRPRFTPPKHFLVLISVTGWVNLRAIAQLEGLGKLMTSLEMEPATFWLVA